MSTTAFVSALPLGGRDGFRGGGRVCGRRAALARAPRRGGGARMAGAGAGLSKVVVAGGSGFVGQRLCRRLLREDVRVAVLTRDPGAARTRLPAGAELVRWDGGGGGEAAAWEGCLRGADAVVNLCGTPVVSRWTPDGKRDILQSRLRSTRGLVAALGRLRAEEAEAEKAKKDAEEGGEGDAPKTKSVAPKVYISASAVGYYGVSDSATFDETSGPGHDFLADVCTQWEQAAVTSTPLVARTIILRFGVVLGLGGGALAQMLPFFRAYLGGPIGSGRQWVSWIHLDDLVSLLIRACLDPTLSGVYNATAPTPVTMSTLAAALARALSRPALLPVPALALRLLLGQGATVVLDGQRALPRRLLAHGFRFRYPAIDDAMAAIAKELAAPAPTR